MVGTKDIKLQTWVGLGVSRAKEPFSAGREAAIEAKFHSAHEKADLGLLFSTIEYAKPETMAGIQHILPKVPLIGCSGAGIISPKGLEKKALALMLISSQKMRFTLGASPSISETGTLAAGQALAKELSRYPQGQRREILILFTDGLISNSSQILQGLQEFLGRSFPIIGAAAADNFRFYKTYQYFENSIRSNSVVGIMIGGEAACSIGIHHGWRPLGKPRRITQARGNIIYAIEGRPAKSLYEDYFGRETEELYHNLLSKIAVLYPIGILVEGEEEYLLRNVIHIREDGALVCQGAVTEGAQIRLMMGTKDSALLATRQALLEAVSSFQGNKIEFALVFISASRSRLLGRDAQKEVEAIKELLGENVPFLGIYTFGEEAPLKSLSYGGQTRFHNQTFTVLLVGS